MNNIDSSGKISYKRTTIRDLLQNTNKLVSHTNSEDAIYYNDDDDLSSSIIAQMSYLNNTHVIKKYFPSNEMTPIIEQQQQQNDDENDFTLSLDFNNNNNNQTNARKRHKTKVKSPQPAPPPNAYMSTRRKSCNNLRQDYVVGDEDEDFYTQTRLWDLEEKLSLPNVYSYDYVKIFEDGTSEL